MVLRSRGRHRRPGRAAQVIGTASAGGITAGMIMVSQAAYAAPLPAMTQIATAAYHASQAAPQAVTVRPGDYLSGIARDHCGNPADWRGIYQRNEKIIGPDPDMIVPGQILVISCRAVQLPVLTSAARPEGDVRTSGMGAFQACVIRAESGGNPQIWNASGHWGLYQFAYGTWVAHGGPPADFGHAGAAEQTRIFWNTIRDDGGSDWQPYDHCSF